MVLNNRQEYGAKANPSRFASSFSIEYLEKVGTLNFRALHYIAVQRCKLKFDYDGNAYVDEYRCNGNEGETQHIYISTEDRFVCASGHCDEKDFLKRLSVDDDLVVAYDYLEEAKTKVTLDPVAALIREEEELPIEEEAKVTEGEFVPGDDYDSEIKTSGLKNMSTVMEEDCTFLIENLIPDGELVVLAGSGGEGKSYVSLAIAAAISKGYGFPYTKDKKTKKPPKSVLLYTKEDSLEKILAARLRILEARKENIWASDGIIEKEGENGEIEIEIIDLSSKKGLQQLVRDIRAKNPALIIIDPATAFCGGLDLERRPHALKFLYPLAEIAKNTNVPIILIFHFNKDYSAEMLVTRIAGSAAIVDAARSVLTVIKNPDNLAQRLIVHVKGNYSEKGKSLIYEVKKDEFEQEGKKGPGRFEWLGESKINIVDINDKDRNMKAFILAVIKKEAKTEYNGYKWMLATTLAKTVAEKFGVSERTVGRCRNAMQIPYDRFDSDDGTKRSFVRLPDNFVEIK